MKTTLTLIALMLGPGSFLLAQAPAEPTAEAKAQAAAIEAELRTFTSDWRKEQADTRRRQAEEARKAKEEGRPAPRMARSMRMSPDYAPFVQRFLSHADKAEGEDAALFLAHAVKWGDLKEGRPGRQALDRLVADHAASQQWRDLGSRFARWERVLGTSRHTEMTGILAAHPDADVRGWVAMARFGKTIEKAARDSEAYGLARKEMMAAAEAASDRRLVDNLRGAIELREKFGIGATAPDIAGIDLDGVAFKLSDYKGKVIFLDFWGDW